MSWLIDLALNPKVWIAIVAAVLVAWIAFTFKQNADLKHTIDNQKTEITQLHTNIDQLNANVKLQQGDIERLDKLSKFRIARQQSEAQFNEQISHIPQTNDHPFSNPDLLDYANRLRDFQNQSNSTPGTSNNH